MNRYFQEVLDAHQLIVNWFAYPDTPPEVCDQLLTHFSPDYSMVTPSGNLLDYATLSSFFYSQGGAKLGLEINIEHMQLIQEGPQGAVVSYQERQLSPGQPATRRFSTVVFELGADNQILWRHLHETLLAP